MKIIDTDIAIVGGGASGLVAGIAASRYGCNNITILEKLPRVGKKILSTGNGRCNLTNSSISSDDYDGDTELLSYISSDIENSEEIFSSLGLICKADDTGRVYPFSNAATSVLDALRFTADFAGINTICDCRVTDIIKTKCGFTMTSGDTQITAKRVILAAGGKAAPSLGTTGDGYELCKKLGHSLTKLYPALAPIRTDVGLVKAVKGLRVAADVSLIANGKIIDRQSGEVQFTDGALSGICIFNLSAKAAKFVDKGEISLDTAPTLGKEELYSIIKSSAEIRATLPCEELLTGIYHKRIGQAMLKKAGIAFTKTCGEITPKEISLLCYAAKDSRYPIKGVSDWSLAQITCGGIPASEVSDKLESLKADGLYLCGEILNIQGKCGGYNLDWAWKSGYTAGMNASLSLSE